MANTSTGEFMSQRHVLTATAAFVWLSLATIAFAQAPDAAAATPVTNILVLLADDLGWGDIRLHGGVARTTNIDRLAQEGVELRRYYAYPFCSPTRAALLTGQMPRRFGIINPLQRAMKVCQPGCRLCLARCKPLAIKRCSSASGIWGSAARH